MGVKEAKKRETTSIGKSAFNLPWLVDIYSVRKQSPTAGEKWFFYQIHTILMSKQCLKYEFPDIVKLH